MIFQLKKFIFAPPCSADFLGRKYLFTMGHFNRKKQVGEFNDAHFVASVYIDKKNIKTLSTANQKKWQDATRKQQSPFSNTPLIIGVIHPVLLSVRRK